MSQAGVVSKFSLGIFYLFGFPFNYYVRFKLDKVCHVCHAFHESVVCDLLSRKNLRNCFYKFLHDTRLTRLHDQRRYASTDFILKLNT